MSFFLIFEPQIQPEKCNKKQFRSVPEVGQDDLYRLEMNSIWFEKKIKMCDNKIYLNPGFKFEFLKKFFARF